MNNLPTEPDYYWHEEAKPSKKPPQIIKVELFHGKLWCRFFGTGLFPLKSLTGDRFEKVVNPEFPPE